MAAKQRILIADDEPTITELFASILTRADFDVTKASDGEECVQKAKSSSFDLILLDVQMPIMDGYEAIKQLKQMPHLKFTPVIFLSGYSTTPENIEAGYRHGATEYWKKPMSADEFEVRVRAVLKIGEAEKKLREMQDGFISMIVHDLRGPLGGIVGFAEMLSEEREKLDPEIAELTDEIGKAAKFMLNIVVDFLEITRLETGDVRMTRIDIGLSDIIERSIASLSDVIKEKSVLVKMEIDDTLKIFADPDRMEKVFTQLLDNALRFTPAGGSVAFSAASSRESIVITVRDTGKGIPARDLPMLFDKMRITTPGSKRAGSKTGLGLPICRGIIEAHDGTISAESKEGEGTTITIRFPIQSVSRQT